MESFQDLANRIDSDSESEEISTADSGKKYFSKQELFTFSYFQTINKFNIIFEGVNLSNSFLVIRKRSSRGMRSLIRKVGDRSVRNIINSTPVRHKRRFLNNI